MFTRRRFLTGTAATGVALTTQRTAPAIAQQKRLIVDSQIHMWPPSTPERPWVPGTKPQLPEPFTIERLVPLMDEAGVERVVIVPPTLEGERQASFGDFIIKGVKGEFYPCKPDIFAATYDAEPEREEPA